MTSEQEGPASLILPNPWYSLSMMLTGPREVLSVRPSVHLCHCWASALCTGCCPLTARSACPPLHTISCSSRPQAIFTILLGPFTFFDVQKTKYLQILTSLMRWIGESEKSPKCLPFSPAPPSTSAEKPGKLPAGARQWLSSLGLPGLLTFPEGKEEQALCHLLLLGKFSTKKKHE